MTVPDDSVLIGQPANLRLSFQIAIQWRASERMPLPPMTNTQWLRIRYFLDIYSEYAWATQRAAVGSRLSMGKEHAVYRR